MDIEQLGKNYYNIKMGTRTTQPNIEMLIQIAECLEIKVDGLLKIK